MSYIPVNPYCSLQQLLDEIKIESGEIAAATDRLNEAICLASRFVDDYMQRDYFYHNHAVTALTVSEYDYPRRVFHDVVCLPPPIITLTELKVGDQVLVEDNDFVRVDNLGEIRKGFYSPSLLIDRSAHQFGMRGNVFGLYSPSNRMTVKGTFGYPQTVITSVTEAGDAASQLSNWSLTGIGTAVLYWKLEDVAGSARVRLYSDSAFSTLVAHGTGAHVSTITLSQDNASGIQGTVDVAYTIDDIDAANTLTPAAPVTDTSTVPQGIPSQIVKAVIMIAAAYSGDYRREVQGMDAQKTELIDRKIPPHVFQILGARPMLI